MKFSDSNFSQSSVREPLVISGTFDEIFIELSERITTKGLLPNRKDRILPSQQHKGIKYGKKYKNTVINR